MQTYKILLNFVVVAIFVVKGNPTNNPFEESAAEARDTKIVGGVAVNIEQYPYQVSLQYRGNHFCGGSIISNEYILTAAHCIRIIGNASIVIRAGTSFHASGGVSLSVVKSYSHPNYAKEAPQDYDISILKVKGKLVYSKAIKNTRLPTSEVTKGMLGTITGWGALSEAGVLPKQLMAANVSVVDRKICANQYQAKKFIVTNRMICGTAPGKDSCNGDSGGPYVYNGQLVGITSWGYGCARDGFPGVYTNVYHPDILRWIRQIADPNYS